MWIGFKMKKSIKDLNINELSCLFNDLKQPSFRLDQVLFWLFNKGVTNFSEMTNLPHNVIDVLSSDFVITYPSISEKLFSKDGTVKYILLTNNKDINSKIECVAIPQSNKNNVYTLCVSCQIGCAMNCAFCATGKQGFTRNLSMGEIIDQINIVKKDLNCNISNIVFMGQGEPFLNFDNLKDALLVINSKKFLGIGARKITVSTCGIINGIEKFKEIDAQYGLAISLHSAIQETRNLLMPNVQNLDLTKLKQALQNYQIKTNRRITFEYLLIDKINSSTDHLNALIKYCKNIKVHINLINYNETERNSFKSVNNKLLNYWMTNLNSNGIETTIRESKGSDIAAACGQLINKSK